MTQSEHSEAVKIQHERLGKFATIIPASTYQRNISRVLSLKAELAFLLDNMSQGELEALASLQYTMKDFEVDSNKYLVKYDGMAETE